MELPLVLCPQVLPEWDSLSARTCMRESLWCSHRYIPCDAFRPTVQIPRALGRVMRCPRLSSGLRPLGRVAGSWAPMVPFKALPVGIQPPAVMKAPLSNVCVGIRCFVALMSDDTKHLHHPDLFLACRPRTQRATFFLRQSCRTLGTSDTQRPTLPSTPSADVLPTR